MTLSLEGSEIKSSRGLNEFTAFYLLKKMARYILFFKIMRKKQAAVECLLHLMHSKQHPYEIMTKCLVE